MNKLFVSAGVYLGIIAVCHFVALPSSSMTELNSEDMENINGATITCGSALTTRFCGSMPVGFDPALNACNDFQASATATLELGEFTLGVTAGDTYCFGGCSSICDSHDIRKYCTSSVNSFCDSNDEDPCTGGTLYTSPNSCPAALATTQGCVTCSYCDSGGC